MTSRYLVVIFGFVLVVVRSEECMIGLGSTNGNCSSTSFTDNGVRTCADITCPKGEICRDTVIYCIKAPCPIVPGCVPIPQNPCWNVTCGEGEICNPHVVTCVKAPCLPIPVCEPIQPKLLCPFGDPLKVEYTGKPVICGSETGVSCPYPYQCQWSLNNVKEICCPREENLCATVLCPPGKICKARQVYCITAPCPLIASCEPIEPQQCEYGEPLIIEYTGQPVTCTNRSHTVCPKPYQCQRSLTDNKKICCPCEITPPECPLFKCKACDYYKYDENGCRTCECIDNPCLSHKCKRGEICTLQEVQCIRAPCPPIPTCIHECPLRNCVENCDYYKFDQNGCRTCECIKDPCLTHPCKRGQVCKLIDVKCIREPCPPVPTCVPNCPIPKCQNQCDVYKYNERGCITCECYNPCSNHTCEIGQTCKLIDVQCIQAPCPPIPECVPDCPLRKCSQYCDYYKEDENGCKSCECFNPCETVKCTKDTECKVVEVLCKKPPCPPIAECVPKHGI